MNHREIEMLLQDLFEGCLEAEDLRRLEAELRANPEARDLYRDYVHLHNGLQLRAIGIDLLQVVPMDRVIARQHRRLLKLAGLSAAALLILTGIIGALVTMTQPKPRSATVDASANSQWTIDGETPDPKTGQPSLTPGSTVRIQSGTLRLHLDNGADIVVQGPASVRFPTLEKPVLERGWLWIDSRESGASFGVATPGLLVRDIGTRFGVGVPEHGPAEVHVVEGKVEVLASATRQFLHLMEPDEQGLAIEANGEMTEVDQARDPFPSLEELLTAPSNYPTTVLGQSPSGYWRLEGGEPNGLANEMAGGVVGSAGSGVSLGQSGPTPSEGFGGFGPDNRAARFVGPAATARVSLGTSPSHNGVILRDDFDGKGPLDGTVPDVAPDGAKWVAVKSPSNFGADGFFVGRGENSAPTRGGSATLRFKAGEGVIYTLDASVTGLDDSNNWLAFGFASGQSSRASKDARFLGNAVAGRAWMLLRGREFASPDEAILGTSGSKGGVANVRPWTGWQGGHVDHADLRIVLDTTGGPEKWTATWYAKPHGAKSYLKVRETARLLSEDISSVGFAVAGEGASGRITHFSLRAEPKSRQETSPQRQQAPAEVKLSEGAVSFWFRSSQTAPKGEILWAAGRSPQDDGIHARIEPDGRLGFFMENGRFDILLRSENGVTDDRWHHVATTWSPSAVALYLDGRLVASDTDFWGSQQGMLGALGVGSGPPGKGLAPFSGWIDEFALWNRALNPIEVSQQFRSAHGGEHRQQ